MYVFGTRVFLATALALCQVNAFRTPITGDDFDFTATYKSGLKITQSKPPKDVLSAKEIVFEQPAVVLTDPGSAGRGDRYLAFLEISYVPWVDMVDDTIYSFPWIKTNLIVTENGTLSDELDESESRDRTDEIETSEIRNATIHVWKQNPELMHFIEDDFMPVFWQLATVWSNATSKIDMDFPRASVDFKVRNETGKFRGDVDENGASIVGYVSTSTAASTTAVPTDVPSTTTGSGSVPASTTAGAGEPASTPNTASSQPISSASWVITFSGLSLFVSAISAI
ncbi:uncharacterized protein F4812DRAFT_204512 [Daldinia caldariorum]|uniref:uncharacterized protein n=1 Tax=Daldinia caldariorum TaxID=326644 RepID=UPI00200779F9|nr:uncharacterized protein F4812DRAFT_204512 [Daldinia caldariorum]KAI1472084.1 hypothetical protein F4812DRAFT_204512 [Daldinia caldariorum]